MTEPNDLRAFLEAWLSRQQFYSPEAIAPLLVEAVEAAMEADLCADHGYYPAAAGLPAQ